MLHVSMDIVIFNVSPVLLPFARKKEDAEQIHIARTNHELFDMEYTM